MTNKKSSVKPFLKWAGGKTQLLGEIEARIPFSKKDSFTYIEPFIGSGAVFFWLLKNYSNIKKAVINDLNSDLINAYKCVKNNVHELISILKIYEEEYNSLLENPIERESIYYKKRTIFNTRKSTVIEQSALFIFLNKTCYNGLYRVNKRNGFNVPQGNYKLPKICNSTSLLNISDLLQNVEILNGDYKETIKYASKKSLFYFDPPYKPLSQTSNFNSYAQEVFEDKEQIELKEFCDKLNSEGHNWILSNSDVMNSDPQDPFFDDLYSEYQIERVNARRRINSNSSKRGKVTEILVRNFK